MVAQLASAMVLGTRRPWRRPLALLRRRDDRDSRGDARCDAGHVAAGAGEQPGVERRHPVGRHHASLPQHGAAEQHDPHREAAPEPGQAIGLRLHQEEQQRQCPGTQQHARDADRPVAAGAPPGQQPQREHERQHADRHVGVEDPARAVRAGREGRLTGIRVGCSTPTPSRRAAGSPDPARPGAPGPCRTGPGRAPRRACAAARSRSPGPSPTMSGIPPGGTAFVPPGAPAPRPRRPHGRRRDQG